MPFMVRIFRRWASGRLKTANPSGALRSSQSANFGCLGRYAATSPSRVACARSTYCALHTSRSSAPIGFRERDGHPQHAPPADGRVVAVGHDADRREDGDVAEIQRCQVHKGRNVIERLPK